MKDEYLFYGTRMSIPKGSLHKFIITELYNDGLAIYFSSDKTYTMVIDWFYWPRMCKYVYKMVNHCKVSQLNKGTKSQVGLYTPLSILDKLWQHISMDFVLGLPRTIRQYDSIMVVVDQFSKMYHFIPCNKTFDAFKVAILFLHGVPLFIISDRDVKFVSYLWNTVWIKMRTKLIFSSAFHP